MKHSQQRAVILQLIMALKKNNSWCGETHIQKAAYCLQELMGVDTGFDFILYKHGPYSFDLCDELAAMRADELLAIKLNARPYGPSLRVASLGEEMVERFPKTIGQYKERVDFIAKKIEAKGVAQLERLATALYVTSKSGLGAVDERAKRIHELKPHVSLADARIAVKEIDAMKQEAAAIS
jgi:uncharacterized protein YwgA